MPPLTITITGRRPLTMNAIARQHRHQHRQETLWWRQQAADMAAGRPPFPGPVRVVATPLHANRRTPQDTGAAMPAVKAAIDGLVDAGIIPDDGPDIVRAVTLMGPRTGGDVDGLTLHVWTAHIPHTKETE